MGLTSKNVILLHLAGGVGLQIARPRNALISGYRFERNSMPTFESFPAKPFRKRDISIGARGKKSFG